MESLFEGCSFYVYTNHMSLQHLFTQKKLNLQQTRWLELLNDYDMSVIYHPEKDNVVADILRCMTMVSVSHVEKVKKDLVKDVYRLCRLGVVLEDSPNVGFMVHHNSESPLVVELSPNNTLINH